MHPIVIIGTGLAGFNTVKEFRKLDKETPIVMLTADDGRNYSKPMLSAGFTRKKPPMTCAWPPRKKWPSNSM